MIEEIYDFLINYGFKNDELNNFQRLNEDLYFANLGIVKTNIEFLENKGIEKNEIISIIQKNPFMLTCGSKKKKMLEEIYNSIFTSEEIKELIIQYPSAYTVNPLELQEVIDYINSKKIDLKDYINNNPKILSFDLDEIKNYMGE